MGKKALVLYASNSGNTKKTAYGIYEGLEKGGMSTDIFSIKEKDKVVVEKYDCICAGSPVIWRLPVEEMTLFFRDMHRPHNKVEPNGKLAGVFCSYAGIHLGPKESEAALKILDIEISHLGFTVVKYLSIPGRYGKNNVGWYHEDLYTRPNKSDLEKAFDFGVELAGLVISPPQGIIEKHWNLCR